MMNDPSQAKFPGRIAVQQRVLPAYRVPFFDQLAEVCEGGLKVFAGMPQSKEGIHTADLIETVYYQRVRNIHLGAINNPLYLCWQQGLLASLKTWNPDILVVEANPRYPTTRAAVRWMKSKGRRVIGWGLGAPQPRGPFKSIRLRGREKFLKEFDALIAYSRRGKDEYTALGIPQERVFVATNAVAPRPTEPLKNRPFHESSKGVILFVGRLQTRKRLDQLFTACAALPLALQPKIWVVGDGPARKRLKALALEHYPNTVFWGAQHGPELETFFNGADLFVLPGTGGLAIQQAMGHGLPVIVAQGDGTQDDLVRPENGWTIPPGNERALTRALKEALSDLARLRKMGGESYRIVRDEINLEEMVAVFLETFNVQR